jgi:site-specific DNA-methyltransferase (adenine-specific)
MKELTITNEDNMALMARYEDNYFDLAIVDPPYGIGQDGHFQENKNGWKDYEFKNWDNETPKDEYFIQLFRVSKKQIIWGGNYFKFLWNYSNSFLIWNKMQRNFTLADGELAWYSETKKAMRTFDFSRGGALADNNKNGGRFHPTQKPVKLYEWLLMNYAKEGDKILDTHLGSGSIAIAIDNVNKIDKMNLTLTACELDKEYFNKSMERIKTQTAQQTLF